VVGRVVLVRGSIPQLVDAPRLSYQCNCNDSTACCSMPCCANQGLQKMLVLDVWVA
jgi:hypothetical protein